MNCPLGLLISAVRLAELPRQRYDCVVALHPVGGVQIVQPGSGNAEIAATPFRQPQKRRADAVGLALEIAQNRAAAAVTGDLLVKIAMQSQGELLRNELVKHRVDVQLVARLVIRGVVLSIDHVTGDQ